MKVKIRMIGNKMDTSTVLLNNTNLQLGTTIYVERFPATKDAGVMTVLDEVKNEENLFHIAVKSSAGELLGEGAKFRSKIISRETGEAVLTYNINQLVFENRMDFYTVELWNKETLIDRFNLKSDTNIYNIYNNLDEKGTISLI